MNKDLLIDTGIKMIFVFILKLSKSSLFRALITECMPLLELIWLHHSGAIMTCSFLSSLVASLAQYKAEIIVDWKSNYGTVSSINRSKFRFMICIRAHREQSGSPQSLHSSNFKRFTALPDEK